VSTTEVDAPVTAPATDEVPTVHGLIDGTWVKGAGDVKETISPSHGGVVSTCPFFTSEQVDAAVQAAKAAQKEWAAVPLVEKARMIHAGLDAVAARSEEISVWVSSEMGKTIREAREEVLTDITVPVGNAIVEDALRFNGRVVQPARPDLYPNRRVMVIYQPIGVTGFISPWNFPVEMIINCIASLMVGNTCVWKPSEWAPYGPQKLTEAFLEGAQLPPGVLNLIYGGPETGDTLVTNDDVGLISFIGSTATGEKIASAAGVKRLLLELGGNGPLVILDDADVDKAVATAMSDCFYQAGQVCTAGERVLVHEKVHDEFVEKLAAKVAELKVGDPLDESTDMGPLSDVRILDKVVRHVEDARAKGASILTGGKHEGQFYEPTILTGVTTDMEIAQEETFGPVAPVIKIKSADEALEIANSSPYGLSMAVFTTSLPTAWKMAEGLEAGQVNVNAGTNDWELNGPFGGWKKSGIGREIGGDESLRIFANVKTVGMDLE
jgi:succinate-semialdehyde dehydrogenase/glutarate-semialdehyde dehydrogenase